MVPRAPLAALCLLAAGVVILILVLNRASDHHHGHVPRHRVTPSPVPPCPDDCSSSGVIVDVGSFTPAILSCPFDCAITYTVAVNVTDTRSDACIIDEPATVVIRLGVTLSGANRTLGDGVWTGTSGTSSPGFNPGVLPSCNSFFVGSPLVPVFTCAAVNVSPLLAARSHTGVLTFNVTYPQPLQPISGPLGVVVTTLHRTLSTLH